MNQLKFRDVFRAQLYLKELHEAHAILQTSFRSHNHTDCNNIDQLTVSTLQQIADQLDKMVLPVTACEIAIAKRSNQLHGSTPTERYESFFLENQEWTPALKGILKKYPVLKSSISKFVSSTLVNIQECLNRLEADMPQLILSGLIQVNKLATPLLYVTGIQLALGDRHLGGRCTMAVSFSQRVEGLTPMEHRVVYKPTPLDADEILSQFVQKLQLRAPYDLLTRPVVNRSEYGWLQYMPHRHCIDKSQVQNYFKRSGCLLAVLDSLNFCDGHFENILACGEYPILLDCETLFQYFGFDDTIDNLEAERSILNTGLVEKPPIQNSGKGYSSAFQAPAENRYAFLHPYALDDGTDELKVRYRGISHERDMHHCPFISVDGTTSYFTAAAFRDEFVDGYQHGYHTITANTAELLADTLLFSNIAKAKCRQLVRHTLYYSLLCHKLHQPDLCKDMATATSILLDMLNGPYLANDLSTISPYELEEILQQSIPRLQTVYFDFQLYVHIYTTLLSFSCTPSFVQCEWQMLHEVLSHIRLGRDKDPIHLTVRIKVCQRCTNFVQCTEINLPTLH